MPKRGLKIGKDVLDKKSCGILTAKEREGFEEWKRQKLAEDKAMEEKDEQKEQELHGKKLASKMPHEREPPIEGLSPEDFARMKALSRKKKVETR